MQTEQHIKIRNEFSNGIMYQQLCYYDTVGDHKLNITKAYCPQHSSIYFKKKLNISEREVPIDHTLKFLMLRYPISQVRKA